MSLSRIWNAALKAAPLRLWAMILAGPAFTAGAVALALVVWRGGWPPSLAGKQLDFLGYGFLIVLGVLAVIVISLAAVRVKAAGLGGTSFEVDGDPDAPAPAAASVTTTTTATVSPAPDPNK